MNGVDWEDDSAVMGKVFKAVKCKGSGKEHGCVGNKVEGMWARVHEVIRAKVGQRSNRYVTVFFTSEDDAQEGSGVEATLEETFTLNALQGHAGFKAVVDGGDSDEASGDEEGEAEAELASRKEEKKQKKKQNKSGKKANDEALKVALAAAGLTKSDVLWCA